MLKIDVSLLLQNTWNTQLMHTHFSFHILVLFLTFLLLVLCGRICWQPAGFWVHVDTPYHYHFVTHTYS